MITVQQIRVLIAQGKEYKFYKSKEWLELRNRILEQHHYECHECLKRGRYTRAKLVHHINELKDRPDLALSEHYTDNGEKKRNLVPLCQECHNIAHQRICSNEYKSQLNDEKW